MSVFTEGVWLQQAGAMAQQIVLSLGEKVEKAKSILEYTLHPLSRQQMEHVLLEHVMFVWWVACTDRGC